MTPALLGQSKINGIVLKIEREFSFKINVNAITCVDGINGPYPTKTRLAIVTAYGASALTASEPPFFLNTEHAYADVDLSCQKWRDSLSGQMSLSGRGQQTIVENDLPQAHSKCQMTLREDLNLTIGRESFAGHAVMIISDLALDKCRDRGRSNDGTRQRH